MAERIATARTPRGEVVLAQRDDGALELRVNGVFVMDTVETATEIALAEVALAQVADPRNVMVGGLGLGYTLRAVLDDTRVEQAVVVEIEEPVVDWMRDGTVPHGPAFFADRRVGVVTLDVRSAVAEATAGHFDLVLLDVDNGPDHLVHGDNAALYADPFLADCRRALAPGGALVVWSATESADLAAAMGRSFDAVSTLERQVRLQGHDESYWLHVATVDA